MEAPLTLLTWLRAKDAANFESMWRKPEVIAAAAGLPLRVINVLEDPKMAPEWIARADGLLLTGGEDIDASFLQQPLSLEDYAKIESPNLSRDRWEFATLPIALAMGLPVLAICRGLQVLNVALGGTLHLDVAGHQDPECKFNNLQLLRHAKGPKLLFDSVNSAHHQILDSLAPGLEVESWCAPDAVIEQVRGKRESKHLPGYCFGTQYHPERHPVFAPIFVEFIAAAVAHHKKRK